MFLLCGNILTFSWGPLVLKLEFCGGMHQYMEIWGLDIEEKWHSDLTLNGQEIALCFQVGST